MGTRVSGNSISLQLSLFSAGVSAVSGIREEVKQIAGNLSSLGVGD